MNSGKPKRAGRLVEAGESWELQRRPSPNLPHASLPVSSANGAAHVSLGQRPRFPV